MEASEVQVPISATALEVGDRITGVGWRDHAGAPLALNDDAHAGRVTLLLFATTTKSAGTGLGLLSSRRIMDEMGGSIALFPRTAGGTRALVLLPLAAAAELVEAS